MLHRNTKFYLFIYLILCSFNFPNQARGAAVSDDVVHLSSQRYSICIRKPAGTTRVCYIPCTVPGQATDVEDTQVSKHINFKVLKKYIFSKLNF